MRSDVDDVMVLPSWERQVVALLADDRTQQARDVPSGSPGSKGGSPSLTNSVTRTAISAGPTSGPGVAAAGAAILLAGAADLVFLKKAPRETGQTSEILYLTNAQAAKLRFPLGHPQRNVVYARNPLVDGLYHPVSDFHHALFQSRAVEALKLLVALGATTIEIEYHAGSESMKSFDLSGAVPGFESLVLGGGVKRTTAAESALTASMRLAPTMPAHVPDDLVWFEHEDTWDIIATGRLKGGLKEFTIVVSRTEDYGVNASLQATIERLGLGLGGEFSECGKTRCVLSGTFGEP